MVSPQSQRRGGTAADTAATAGNAFVSSMQHRRSSKSSIANGSSGFGGARRPVTVHGNRQRKARRRKWFRSGGRKNNVLEIVMAFGSICFWALVFRLEYSALDDSNSVINNYIYSKNHNNNNKTIVKQPSYNNDENKIIRTQSNGPDPRENKPRKSSHEYDSIFCPVSTFQQQDESSSRTNGISSNPRRHRSTQHLSRPVFLWGIPSTQSEFETGRRELLRKTYLGFYEKLWADTEYQNSTNATVNNFNYGAICSFHDWTCNSTVRADCQMIYVFFVGGHKNNTSITPILLNESITNYRDMLLPIDQAKAFDLREPGIVYLDIRENQFDGKMTTWFKFASLVANEYNSDGSKIPSTTASVDHLGESNITTNSSTRNNIEYVFKVDSDLILFTPHFFHWFERVHDNQQKLQGYNIRNKLQEEAHAKPPTATQLVRRVYGGIEFPATNCVENFTFDHPCPLPLSGPSYMSGELNFVSVDLAEYIASDNCPRERWTIPHEDVSLSNYVYSYTNNTEYHKREQRQSLFGNELTREENKQDENDHSLRVVGINVSNVLLLPNMRADWQAVSIRKTPDVLRTGELLWAHSIRRGNHSQYLFWKNDIKFRDFWNRIFYRAFTTTGNSTFKRYRRRKKKEGIGGLNRTAEGIGGSNRIAGGIGGSNRIAELIRNKKLARVP